MTTDGQWVAAGELAVGTEVRSADGHVGVVDAIAFVAAPKVMYNISVADAHTYAVGDGQWVVHNACAFSSVTGYAGRLESVTAYVTINDLGTGQATNLASRLWARALGRSTDDAGHAIARNLGGFLPNNIFPQSVNINRGAYRQFERFIAETIVETGSPASIYVQLLYDSATSTRPTEIIYEATINGNILNQIFSNP